MSRLVFAFVTVTLVFSGVAKAQISGSPNAQAITRLNQPRGASITANSVDTGTGAFSMDATVLSVNGGRPIEFSLVYDTLGPPGTIIGQQRTVGLGWTHPYAARLQGNPGSIVTVWWDDNRRNTFDFSGGDYVPRDESAQYDVLTYQNPGWRMVRFDGSEFYFDDDGRLTRIQNKIRQKLEIERDGNGRISKVVEPISDKEIGFRYPSGTSGRISYLTDPADREVHFIYDSKNRLRAIHNPTEFGSSTVSAFVPIDIPDDNPGGVLLDYPIARVAPIGLLKITSLNIDHQRTNDVRVTLTSPQGTVVEFQDQLSKPSANNLDAQGLVLQEFEGENPSGVWQLRVTDEVSGMTGRVNGFNFSLSDRTYPTYLTYDTGRRLIEAADADGMRRFSNTYDGLSRVVAQDDGRDDTPPSTFSYADLPGGGLLTTYTNRNGEQQIYEHDSSYHLMRYVNALGAETTYTYNSNGERTSIRDPLGRTTAFEFDVHGNITRVVDPAGNASQMTYSLARNLLSFTDALGEQTSFSYGGGNGNVTRVTDSLGNRTNKGYGGNGQLISNLMEDGAGVDYTYSGGMVTGARRIDASGSKVEKTDYDAIGFPTSLTDAEGRETKLEYDERLNTVARINPLGRREEKEFDIRNRLVRLIDFNGNQTTFTYDGNNNLVSRTNPLGQTTVFVYDAEDRRTETIDAMGRSTRVEYDAAGRLVNSIDALGNESRRVYDAVGNVTEVYDAQDRLIRSVIYDVRDQPVEVTDAVGNRLRSTFDALGSLTSITDEGGSVTQFRYDELGRLIEVEDPLGRVTKKEYFSDDVVKRIINAGNGATSISYDKANRIREIEPPDGSIAQIQFNWDEAYQVTQDRLPGGARRDYTYDDAGRLINVDFVGDGKPGDRSMIYDHNGNMLQVNVSPGGNDSPGVQLQREYDALDRVTKFTDVHGTSLRYSYDSVGNLTKLTYPDGKALNYIYDDANQLVEVVDWASRSTTFTYTPDSRIASIEFPNGVVRSMVYDIAGRILERRDVRGATTIVEYFYEYDEQGQVTVESGGPSAPPYLPSSMAMTYNQFSGKLETVNGTTVSYDVQQNIISAPLNGALASFEYNLNKRLIRVNGFDREYDAADNLTAWDGPGGRTRLSVNPQSALAQVVMKRDPNGTVHHYVYAGGLLYDEVGGDMRVYHYDYRGNTVAFSDESGNVTGTVSYGPYGEISSRSGSTESIFLHGALWGIITDPVTELQYMRFRWYSPQLKRFLSRDGHLGDITGQNTMNRYAYAGANPVSINDPTGELLNFLAAGVGAVAGAVIGVGVTVVSKAISGEKITAGDIIGSAIGGAVTGGLVGLCAGVCGPAALIAGGVVAGALGAGGGNALGQGIDIATGAQTGGFDGGEFGTEVAAGAIFGAIPFAGKGGKAVAGLSRGAKAGASRAAAKGFVSRSLRKIATPAGDIPILIPKRALGGRTIFPAITGKSAVREAAKASARKSGIARAVGSGFIDTGVGLWQTAFTQIATSGVGSPPSTTAAGAASVLSVSRDEINEGGRGVHGEFHHWKLYQTFHLLTGTPLPNNPNNPMAEF